MVHHDLKCHLEWFALTWANAKPVEIRFNDRNFQPGDTFTLHEYNPRNSLFIGRKIHGRIWAVYGSQQVIRSQPLGIASLPGIMAGWVILFFNETGRDEAGPALKFEEGETA